MEKKQKKGIVLTEEEKKEIEIKDFFDLVAPSVIKFYPDHYICGNHYCATWAIRDYPRRTETQALLARLGELEGVTLHFYSRVVDPAEQRKIIQNATRVSALNLESNNTEDNVRSHGNMKDIVQIEADIQRSREGLLHLCVYIGMTGDSLQALNELEDIVAIELTRQKIIYDKMLLCQKEGFHAVMPGGFNALGAQFERVLPSASVGNLFPFSYSGKTDPHGLPIGRDKYGSNIIVDFDRRTEDKTNSNIVILGNSGQGKSYLMKLILTNLRESGKSVICIDPEAEYEELTKNLGGTYLDMTSGEYIINPLEPRSWAEDNSDDTDEELPEELRKPGARLSQHIAFLKDLFRSYKNFTDPQIDTVELLLEKMYRGFGITDRTDFSKFAPTDYPTMSDLYEIAEREFRAHTATSDSITTKELLQEICLNLHSMCVGSESRFFNGHTNIVSDRFVCFGVKGIMDAGEQRRNALLFNILSYMNHRLLTDGNTVGAIDELYLFLTNLTSIEYIRNAAKRVRKKDSAIVLASQNIEDFLLEGVREYTKPLFSIPTHQFLFFPGNVDPESFLRVLQLKESEYAPICKPERGSCLYRCGNERYLLQVQAPEHKARLFGSAGGR